RKYAWSALTERYLTIAGRTNARLQLWHAGKGASRPVARNPLAQALVDNAAEMNEPVPPAKRGFPVRVDTVDEARQVGHQGSWSDLHREVFQERLAGAF